MAREGSGGWRTRPGSPAGFLGPKWAGEMLGTFSPDPLVSVVPLPVRLSSSSPLLPSSYAPRTNVARGAPGGRRTRPRSPAGSLGPEWAGETLGAFSPDPPVPEGPSLSASPLLRPPVTPTPLGPVRLEGILEGRGPGPGAQQVPGARVGSGNARHILLSFSSPGGVPPGVGTPTFPIPPLRDANSIRPPLLPPHSPHHIPPSCSGVPPVPLSVKVPQKHLVGALVVGRCELHVLSLCHLHFTSAEK